MKQRRVLIVTLVAVSSFAFCALTIGCSNSSASTGNNVLRVAVTTSTRDSGLLEEILPPFEQESGVSVEVVAVGTGAALKLGERGDVDALLCHAPE